MLTYSDPYGMPLCQASYLNAPLGGLQRRFSVRVKVDCLVQLLHIKLCRLQKLGAALHKSGHNKMRECTFSISMTKQPQAKYSGKCLPFC